MPGGTVIEVKFQIPFARELMSKVCAFPLTNVQLVPSEEFNDALILAESSLAGIPVLVTSDHHLLDIPEDRLLVCLNDADLPSIRVAHPKGLLNAIR